LSRIKPDIYFSPDGFLPNRGNYKKLATIHDLNFEEEDAFLQPKVKQYYQKYIRAAAECADHIFTVSAYSKKDIEERYGIPAEKVSYAHNGPQQKFVDLHKFAQSVKQRYAHTHPYFLFVGAQNPRKNLHRIFQAFDAFCEASQTDHRLLLVGEKMLWDDDINLAWKNMQHQDRVDFTGRLKSKQLNHVYSAATALVYPSLFEGFGMPIVEAFQSGCPVITSLSSSMPEVGGDAALLIDPTRYEEITEAMMKVAKDDHLREELQQKGFARAKQFNWNKAGDLVVSKIKQLMHA
jgi:glycosyltransferase involved in cell wall biosynthesis